MEKLDAIIFDMDGTLYQFPDGASFGQSPLGKAVKQNVTSFLASEFALPPDAAQVKYSELLERYDGEMSLGLEREFGIDRMRFFNETWSIDPENIIVPSPGLKGQLEQLDVQCALLTSAPRAWVTRVLGYMGVADVFGDNIFTGEPDIRKPNPEVFRQIAGRLGLPAARVASVGDQEYSDIVPAKRVGMQAVRIGKNVTSEADVMARDVGGALTQLRQKGALAWRKK